MPWRPVQLAPTPGVIAIGPNYGDGPCTMAMSVGAVSVAGTTTGIVASKDTWHPSGAVCVDDTNKNGTPLEVEGILATHKRSVVGWDLSSLPSGAAGVLSVSSATVTLITHTPPAKDESVSINTIPIAQENWDEATLKCSTRHDLEAGVGSAVVIAAGAEGTSNIWSALVTGRNRIRERMGVGSMTFDVISNDSVGGVNMKFWDKDTGVLAKRPRLDISWSKVLG